MIPMKTKHFLLCIILTCITITPMQSQESSVQNLPYLWNELTAQDFVKAVELSQGICILPTGVMEKHGPHLPLSTDMILAREISSRGAALEYALVFPEFYFGQIFEAKHQPGTLAYSSEFLWKVLEESCEEMARNGIKKIIIVNGHGGNNNLFSYFCQAQLAEQKDYTVVFFRPNDRGSLPNLSSLERPIMADMPMKWKLPWSMPSVPTWYIQTVPPHNPAGTRKGSAYPLAIQESGGMPASPITMPGTDRSPIRRWAK